MNFNLKIEKIAGAESDGIKTAVFSKRLLLGDGTSGNVAACICMEGEGFDLGVLVGDIFELFCKRLEDASGGILEALKIGKEACSDYLSGKDVDTHFAFCVFYKEACYICRLGTKVKIHLYGNEASGEISFGEGSGRLKNGQIFVIATDKFLGRFDTSGLAQAQEVDFEELVDGLATDISAEENQAEMGACLVYAKGEGEEKKTDENAVAPNEKEEEISQQIPVQVEEEHKFEAIPKRRQQSPIAGVFSLIFREIVKIKNWDIGAIARLRRNIVIIALAILLILFGSAAFEISQNNKKQRETKIAGYLSDAKSKYTEAVSLIDLNRDQARQILIDAEGETNSALAIDSKNADANKLKSDIDAKLKGSENAQGVKFDTLADVGAQIVAISQNNKSLVEVDAQKIRSVSIPDKKISDVAGVSGAQAGVFFSNAEFVLLGSSVLKGDLTSGKVGEVAKVGKSSSDIGVFFGNIYLLRSDGITKLIPIEDGYSASDYLSGKSFGSSPRMAIDTSIWVTSGSKVLKFTRGQQESFDISGLVSTSYDFGLIFTNGDTTNLYIIDRKNPALLVVDKKGAFQKVYQAPEFAKAAAISVDEAAGKMYLAVGSKILTASL